MYLEDVVYFSGSAKLPSGIPSGAMYQIINVGLMINESTGEVVDVSLTLLSSGAMRFLEYLIIGFNIHENDISVLIKTLETRYFGDSQKAICMALQRVDERYSAYRKLKNNK